MKRKLSFGLMMLATLFAASCAKDLVEVPVLNEEAKVTFCVNTPEIATRAYSDGKTATALQYAVYDEDGKELASLRKTDATIKGSATVELQLTTGNTYSVIFWAAANDAPYSVDFEKKTMTVDYTSAVSNDEARDAFYAFKEFTVTGAQTETIELRRPFAQLNIGTADYTASANAGYTPTKSAVTVKNIYTTLDLVAGEVSESVEVAFKAADIKKNETFPVAGNEYLAMNYLLVDTEKETVEVEFTYTDGTNAKTRTVGSVPVQRNYRTNIYGNLLTSQVDIKVEIVPEYNEPDYSIYNVVVDGVSYDNFAEAVAKAMELNKAVEFVQNVSIDADETITVPAGKELTLNLNGYTLSGVSDQTGSNRNMFTVKGTMTVNGANTMTRAAAEGNGVISIKHVGDNMGWNSSTNVFDVTAGGVLNIYNTHAINFGGSDMGFVAHLNNWGEVTLNVENSTLKSNYVAVRVFNSGNDMNNVTIKNSTLEGGSYAFWVHNYTVADFGTQEKADAHKALLKFDIFNLTNKFIGKNDTPIRYGFTDAIYLHANGTENGTVEDYDAFLSLISDDTWYDATKTELTIEDVADFAAFVETANSGNDFEGKTIKLTGDIDLYFEDITELADNDPITFRPIGDTKYNGGKPFKGTFDGQGHTIKNLYQNGWDLGYQWGVYGSYGLFGNLEDSTVKNVVIEGSESYIEGGDVSFIAGSATGDCVFENITIKNATIGTYNNGCGGIIGWSGAGNYTFKNITLGEDVVLGGLWGSFDSSIGGIVGQAEPGATYNFENVTINCRIDAYNDCTASYDYYNYRMCGMIIGRCEETTTINGYNYPDLSKYNLTFNNVVVNYGDWMNYHYCRRLGERAVRVEPGYSYDGAEGRDHSGDNQFCMECIPFDQLIGGDQYAVKGLPEVKGVTVNYPASYRREVSTKEALTEALGKGVSVILDDNIDLGNTILTLDKGQTLDLGGKTLTQSGQNRGIILKNGASIKNGVINHSGVVAAVRAWNVESIENVTINLETPASGTVTGIAVQQSSNVGTIKNVTVTGAGVTQAIEVPYQATVDLIENVTVDNSTAANGVALVINGGKVGKAKNCTFKGNAYGVTMHLKGVFNVGLELEKCVVEGTAASIYAWDEKGISNTSGSLVLTYDAATTLTGPFVWDFEDECKSVVTLNKPQ